MKPEFRSSQNDLDRLPERSTARQSAEDEVNAALSLLEDIRRICDDPSARADVLPLLQKLGLRVGLHFADGIKGKKRKVRRGDWI